MSRLVRASSGNLRRRDFLALGSLTAFGVGLSGSRATYGDAASRGDLTAQSELTARGAKSCILIWLDGGPSHIDMFDPKPKAPAEVRGPFAPIQTQIPGVAFSELLPATSKIIDRISVVRSVTSPLGEHNFGTHYMLTGYRPTPVLDYPTVGSVVSHLDRSHRILPSQVAIPNFRVGGSRIRPNGFLPDECGPFSVEGDLTKADFQVAALELSPGMTPDRIARRRRYLSTFSANSSTIDPVWESAYQLLSTADAKQAFDLAAEPLSVREKYGMRPIGQGCLLARRLVERGVRFVTVNNIGWDTHQSQFLRLKEGFTGAKVGVGLVPLFDTAFSALISDLHERSLLDDTLVVVMGEFGRTPKINAEGGRDHWPRVFSVVLAGGGVRGGQVVGSSDAMGESPAERPITPSDLIATIYHVLGLPPETELTTPDERPVKIGNHGQLIGELLS